MILFLICFPKKVHVQGTDKELVKLVGSVAKVTFLPPGVQLAKYMPADHCEDIATMTPKLKTVLEGLTSVLPSLKQLFAASSQVFILLFFDCLSIIQ